MKFIINEKMNVRKSYYPYLHVIIDNFFDPVQLNKLILEWPKKEALWNRPREKVGNKKNLLEHGMRSINEKGELSKKWRDFFNFVHHNDEFINQIRNLVGDENITSDETYNWSGLRENLPGSYQLIHSDAIVHPKTGFEKRFTIMIYFDDPSIVRNGYLELWDDEMKSCEVSIEPFFNRLVIFECTSTSYHGVPKCDYLRKAFTMSFVHTAKKNSSARKKAKFVARPFDKKEVTLQGVLRGKVS